LTARIGTELASSIEALPAFAAPAPAVEQRDGAMERAVTAFAERGGLLRRAGPESQATMLRIVMRLRDERAS
jgi:hypothetical protein